MALKITKKPSDYISTTAYAYDIAKTSQYFDKSVYEGLAESGDQDAIKSYLFGLAGAKDKTASAFDQDDYYYLTSAKDKAEYTLYKLSGDSNSELDAYFSQKVQQGIDNEIWESMNGFEKTINTIVGVTGNTLNAVYGMVENIVDGLQLIIGGAMSGAAAILPGGYTGSQMWEIQKNASKWDLTGTGAIQNALNEYTRKNTYVGKNSVATFMNDLTTGIGQYAVNFIPYVGPILYWSSTAGSFSKEAVEAKPDIDFWSLMGYTTVGTGLSVGIEKISGKMLGGKGSVIDDITKTSTGGAKTAFGEWASKSWVKKAIGSFVSEGLEESIEEFADTALWNGMIAYNNPDIHKAYSLKDVLYAGLIGGTIGFIMDTGRIATTAKNVKVEDGRIVTAKFAKANNLKVMQEFNRTQSLNVNEAIANLKKLSGTSAVADLRTKYANDESIKSDEDLKSKHAAEYEKAVKKDQKTASQLVEGLLLLSKIHGILGDEEFKRITAIANGTYETIQHLADNYASSLTGTNLENRKVEQRVKDIYGKETSFTVADSLTPLQQRLAQNLYNTFGIKTYFGSLGQIEDGSKVGLTISEDTIIIDPKLFGEMSLNEILNTVVKEEIVHTLQFNGQIITPQMLVAVQTAMGKEGVDALTPVDLESAYDEAGTLTKLTEAQAKAVAEVLLFDELTVSKMFYTQYSTLNKVYKVLRNIKVKLEESNSLRKQKNKIKYNKVLKSMKMYRDIAAKRLGNLDNIEEFSKEFQLSEKEFNDLKNAYLPNNEVPQIRKGQFLMSAAFARKKKPDTIEGQMSLEQELLQQEAEKTTAPIETTEEYKSGIKETNRQQVEFNINDMLLEEMFKENLNTSNTEFELIGTTGDSDENVWFVDENGQMVISKEDLQTRLEKQQKRKAKAKQQEESVLLGKQISKNAIDKCEKIIEKLPPRRQSEQRGKTVNEATYIPVEAVFRQNNEDLFTDITSDEYIEMVTWLRSEINNRPHEASAALAHILQYGYDNANSERFRAIQEYILEQNQIAKSYGGQQLGIASATYGTMSIKRLSQEIYVRDGIMPMLTEKDFKTFIPKDMSMEEYKQTLIDRLDKIDTDIKDKKLDAYEKFKLRQEYNSINAIVNAIAINDWSGAFDATINDLRRRDANAIDNTEKIGEMYKAVIEFFLVKTSIKNGKIANFDADNRQLSNDKMDVVIKILSGLQTFRYIALLSSPSTWLKNKITNICVSYGAVVEDVVASFFENTNLFGGKPILDNPNQMRFQGQYNDKFSDFIDNEFKTFFMEYTGGNKYSDSAHKDLIQKYADAKDRAEKARWLIAIKDFENKRMNDQNEVVARSLRNLKHTLAGSISVIRNQVTIKLMSMYHIKDIKTTAEDAVKTKLKESNEKLYNTYVNAMSGSETAMVDVINLALDLKLPVVEKSLDYKESAVYVSLFRANKLLFKCDNVMTKWITDLKNKGHKSAAALIEAVFPFIRSTINTSAYILDRSPIGFVKGIFKLLETRKGYVIDQKQLILTHYKERYINEVLRAEPDESKRKSFVQEEFMLWLDANVDSNTKNAIEKGNFKEITKIYNQMVSDGTIPYDTAGSTNPFARAMALEQIAQGSTGTIAMLLGAILGGALGWFDYDEDDYMGPVLKIGDLKIGLDDLSPFTTMFAAGAMWSTDGFEAFAQTIIDASLFSTFDSAMAYSDGFLGWTENQAINWTQQFIPSIFKSTAKIFDNGVKAKRPDFWGKLLDTTMSNIPFLSYVVPNKINPYTGYPMKRYEYGFVGAAFNAISPIKLLLDKKSPLQKEAERLDAETNGISGEYEINGKKYKMSTKEKEKYAKYNAKYVSELCSSIINDEDKVSIMDEKTGKRVEKYWSKMTDAEKKRTLKQVYSSASEQTKIKWWTDKGNYYYTSNKNKYSYYNDLFGNSIIYDRKWGNKNNFVEG